MKGGPPRVTDERGNGKAYAAVVGHLSLELLERPAARGGQARSLSVSACRNDDGFP
jgi:hypothetical protein